MSNIHIIQAVIPKYRVPFFKKVLIKTNKNIFFYCAKHFKGYPSTEINDIDFKVNFFTIKSFRNIFFWFSNLQIFHHLKKNDIVVLEGNLRYLNNYLIYFYAKTKKCKIIWWSIYDMPYSSKLNKTIREIVMNFVDFNLVYTQLEYLNFTSKFKNFKKIAFLNNTIDISNYNIYRNVCIETKKNYYNIPNNKNILVYCGRLTKKPKLEIVFKFLHDFDIDNMYHFLVIGDGEEKENFLKLVKSYKIEMKVSFLGAIYDEAVLSEYLNLCDLFVYPGSVGLSLFTAFANYLPVITHDEYKYQAPEFYAIQNNFNSILFKYLDIADFNFKIKNYFENKNCIHIMKLNAFNTVSKKFTIDKMANNFINSINNKI